MHPDVICAFPSKYRKMLMLSVAIPCGILLEVSDWKTGLERDDQSFPFTNGVTTVDAGNLNFFLGAVGPLDFDFVDPGRPAQAEVNPLIRA